MKDQYSKKLKNWIKKNDEVSYRLKGYKILFFQYFTKIISDRKFIEIQYRLKTGKRLNLEKPTSYNEKLQWMKINYKDTLLNKCVDKYEVRDYVKNKVGEDILIPLLGVYDKVEDINFEKLPNKFVMKLNNGSSFNYICTKKNEEEIKKMKNRFNLWINLNYYSYGKEWAYKNVKNKIICEKILEPISGEPPEDFRFFCFKGKVKFITVDSNSVINGIKNTNYNRNLYTTDWDIINATIQYPQNKELDSKPEKLSEMVTIAEKLAVDFPAVRVDFYYFDNQIYFGELTFYHGSGYQKIEPKEFADNMSNWLELGI